MLRYSGYLAMFLLSVFGFVVLSRSLVSKIMFVVSKSRLFELS